MSRDKRWSSNDKNQLLVENFKKFMEEGDFSPDEEVVDEGVFGKMKGALTGHGKKQAQEFSGRLMKYIKKYIAQHNGNLAAAFDSMDKEYLNTPTGDSIKKFGVANFEEFFNFAGAGKMLQIYAQDAIDKMYDGGVAADEEK